MKDCFLTKNRNKAKPSALITLLNTVLEALVSATRQKRKKRQLVCTGRNHITLFADDINVYVKTIYKNYLNL